MFLWLASIHSLSFSVPRMYPEERMESYLQISEWRSKGIFHIPPALLLCLLKCLGTAASGPPVLLLKQGKWGKDRKTSIPASIRFPCPLLCLPTRGDPPSLAMAPLWSWSKRERKLGKGWISSHWEILINLQLQKKCSIRISSRAD